MGVIESLTSLLTALSPDEVNIANDVDITLGGDDIDLEQIEGGTIDVKSGEHQEKVAIEGNRVVLYPDELQGDEYAQFTQLVRRVKREEGSVERLEEHQQTQALESAEKGNIDETIEFFDRVISPRYLSLLRSCLYLREVQGSDDVPPEFNIDQEKRELKDRYGYEAYYVAHLASSGYFDEDRYFRELYYELEGSDGITSREYQEEFELTVGEKLIAVFVSEDDDVYGVKQDLRATAAKHYRYRPQADFVDVCGVGEACRRTIDEFIDEMSEEYPAMEYENRDREEERVVRVYPGTLQGLSS